MDSLDPIIRNGEYVGSSEAVTRDGNPQKRIVRYDYFESDISIDGKPYIVKWDVEVVEGANNYKTYRITDIEIDPADGGHPGQFARNHPKARSSQEDVSTTSFLNGTLSQNEQKSNTNNGIIFPTDVALQ